MLSRIKRTAIPKALRHTFGGSPADANAGSSPSESARRESGHPEFVPPGHFYSAIPDPSDIDAVALRISGVTPLDALGIDFNIDAQLAALETLAPLVPRHPVPYDASPPDRYHFGNGWYERSDGVFLHLVTRHLAPERIVEVGSGYSSACILDTLAQAEIRSTCVFIDPDLTRIDRLFTPDDQPRIPSCRRECRTSPSPSSPSCRPEICSSSTRLMSSKRAAT